MRLNPWGQEAKAEWEKSAQIRIEIEMDAFVVMPNHVHGIIVIAGAPGRATGRSPLQSGPTRRSLGAFVSGFKFAVTKRIRELRHTPGVSVWQRNYYEHIIRNEESLNRIRQYILENPARWELDRENPSGRLPNPKTRGGWHSSG
jgi:putative transposase